MESLECLKAIVQGPYIPRKQSKIPSLDRSDAIEILENDLQGEIGNCRAGNGGNNVRSNVIAAAGGNQHENNSSSATVHSKEPKTPNKLEKSNKSLKGPGQGEIGEVSIYYYSFNGDSIKITITCIECREVALFNIQ